LVYLSFCHKALHINGKYLAALAFSHINFHLQKEIFY
jgi:hypothetical protein